MSESSLSTVDSTTVGQITNAATTITASTVPNSTSTTPGTTTDGSTDPVPTLPTLSELLNGRTLEALNSIINVTNTNNSNSNTNFKTLEVNQVRIWGCGMVTGFSVNLKGNE